PMPWPRPRTSRIRSSNPRPAALRSRGSRPSGGATGEPPSASSRRFGTKASRRPGSESSRRRPEPAIVRESMTEATPLDDYPAHDASDVVLRSGSTLRLRPIRREDAAALLDFERRLPDDSVYFQFFGIHGVDAKAAKA